MISKAISEVLQAIADVFEEYGIHMQTQYSPDLDLVTEYSKSLNMRGMFTEKQLEFLTEEQQELLKKKTYNLMLYNYSPFRRAKLGRTANIDFQLVFNPNSPESQGEFGKLRPVGKNDQLHEFFEMIRETNANQQWTPQVTAGGAVIPESFPELRAGKVFHVVGLANPANSPIGLINNDEFIQFDQNGYMETKVDLTVPTAPVDGCCRDLVFGELDLTFKILNTDTDTINDIQFLIVKKLQRNKAIEISYNFGDVVGRHEFEYSTEFSDIDSVGHVDYGSFGNLQHVTFSMSFSGAFFSFYTQQEKLLEKICVEFQVRSELDPAPVRTAPPAPSTTPPPDVGSIDVLP